MTLFSAGEGSTPLTQDELEDLIPNLATREELDEWERKNILIATGWALERGGDAQDVVSEEFIRKLHRKMFDQTWKWAGQYRTTEKNIGVSAHELRDRVAALIGDVRYWLAHRTYSADELAVRFHHRLVFIHLFSNGNGRHARIMADLMLVKMGDLRFSWGAANLVSPGEARAAYLKALQEADDGNIVPLLRFVRS